MSVLWDVVLCSLIETDGRCRDSSCRCDEIMSLNCGHKRAYYTSSRYMIMESYRGMTLTGENRRTRRRTCLNGCLSTTNPTWTDPGANPDQRLTSWALARRSEVQIVSRQDDDWSVWGRFCAPATFPCPPFSYLFNPTLSIVYITWRGSVTEKVI
jgi:hypothetical protein